MPFKINIGDKSGKTFKLELESEELFGKELGNILQGKDLFSGLEGYELQITGLSDKAGFTAMQEVPGVGLKKLLLTYGKGMHRRPRKEGKKKRSNPVPKGLRLRKTVRGRVISPEIVQINLKVIKQGAKALSEVFSDQANQTKELKENRKKKREKTRTEKEKPEEIKETNSEKKETTQKNPKE